MTAAKNNPVVVGAIFDLDGVLTDTADAHARAWKKLADAHAFTVTDAQLDEVRGRSRVDSLLALMGERRVPAAAFEAMLDEKNRYYIAEIGGLTPRDVLPGALHAIAALTKRGVRLAVGSASKNARAVLDALELTPLFTAIVDGNDVSHPKPDPEVFLLAAKRLGVAPTHCVVIEDAPSGIAAAKAANMMTVGIGAHLVNEACDVKAGTLTDIDFNQVIDLLERR